MIVTRTTYRKRSLECVSTPLEQQQQQQQNDDGNQNELVAVEDPSGGGVDATAGNSRSSSSSSKSWGSIMTKRNHLKPKSDHQSPDDEKQQQQQQHKQQQQQQHQIKPPALTPPPPECAPSSSSGGISASNKKKEPPAFVSAGSIMSKISRNNEQTPRIKRRNKVSSSSSSSKHQQRQKQQPPPPPVAAYSRCPVVLLPLPLLHLGKAAGGKSSSKQQQQTQKPKQHDDSWGENRGSCVESVSDYSSDDSSAHSQEYYWELQRQQTPPPPPPTATLAVAQLIENKVIRLQAERAKQVERQRLVQEEREKGVWMSYNIRLMIYLQAKRAEQVKQAAKIRDEQVEQAANKRAEEAAEKAKQAAQIAAMKAERVDEAAIDVSQNKHVLEQCLNFAQHRVKQDEIDHGHIDIHKNKAALQNQLNFSQHQVLTYKEMEIAAQTQTIPLKKKNGPKVPKEEKVEFDKIGKIAPSLASMIAQAALELRPIPKEHKKEFKPICNDAAEIGRLMRLKEKVVEAQGTRTELEKKEAESSTVIKPWTRGVGTVTLPKFDNARSEAFNIVNEAAALGRLVALKPKVTRNYDEELDYLDDEGEDDIDVLAVDEHGHKDFRMKYLTDVHVRHHQKEKKKYWEDITNLDQTIHDDLDKVELPTGALPVYNKPRKQLSLIEIKEGIAQGVAEKLWERQYRLERPEAELRMRPACSCKYCKPGPNPFQTLAYRKKWLIRQGLWVEPEEEPKPRNTRSKRPDPLENLRKRLVIEKKKEEEIRRETERQKWLAENKDIYSKSKLRTIIEKDAPVLDPEAEAVEQRKENLAVAHQRAKVIKQKTVIVPVAMGESVSARKKMLFQTGISENGKKETTATETTWERDLKGRWIARTGGGEKAASAPEWVNNKKLRHVTPNSKTKAPPPVSISSALPTSTDMENLTSSVAPMSLKDVSLKPGIVQNSIEGVAAQPTKRRMEFLKHLKPPCSPKSNKSQKNSKPKSPHQSPKQLPPEDVKQKKPVTRKTLQELLVEKRREILKVPVVPKDVKLKPFAKLPKSLKEVPTQPAEKKQEFLNVHLKSSNLRIKPERTPIMPNLLTFAPKGAATAPALSSATGDHEDDEFIEEEWSGSDEAADASIYDDDEIVEETIHEEDYVDEEYTEIVDEEEDDEEYAEFVEESENHVEEPSVVEPSVPEDEVNVDDGSAEYEDEDEAKVDDGSEEYVDAEEYDDDSSSYHSQNAEDEDASIEHGYQAVGYADSLGFTSILRRQSIQLMKDIMEIMEDGHREEEAEDSSEFEDRGIQSSAMPDDSGIQGSTELEESGVQSSSMPDDSGIQGSTEFEYSRTQSSSTFDDSGIQGSSDFEESGSLQLQEEYSSKEAHDGNASTKVQEETGEDRPVAEKKVDVSPVSDKDVHNAEPVSSSPLQASKYTSKESKPIENECSDTNSGRGSISIGRKKGKKGLFKQLGNTFGSMLGRKKKGPNEVVNSTCVDNTNKNMGPLSSSPSQSSSVSQVKSHVQADPYMEEILERVHVSQKVEAQTSAIAEKEIGPASRESHQTQETMAPKAKLNTARSPLVDIVDSAVALSSPASEKKEDSTNLDVGDKELIKQEEENVEEHSKTERLDFQPKSPNPEDGKDLTGEIEEQKSRISPSVKVISSIPHVIPTRAHVDNLDEEETPFDEAG